jgi:hypothetical protein
VDSAPWLPLTRSTCKPSRQPPVLGEFPAQIIPAEEPVESALRLFNWLLVKIGRTPTGLIEPVGANGPEVTLLRDLQFRQPAQSLQPSNDRRRPYFTWGGRSRSNRLAVPAPIEKPITSTASRRRWSMRAMTSRAIAESYCMDLGSMAWASSETSSEFFRYWKNDKTCSERCLAEHLRFPILPRRKARNGPRATGGRCADHPARHARFRIFRQTPRESRLRKDNGGPFALVMIGNLDSVKGLESVQNEHHCAISGSSPAMLFTSISRRPRSRTTRPKTSSTSLSTVSSTRSAMAEPPAELIISAVSSTVSGRLYGERLPRTLRPVQ